MGLRILLLCVPGIAISAGLLSMPFVFPLTGEGGTDAVAGLGRFHILVLHFPICLLLLVPLLEILGSFTCWEYLKSAARLMLFLAILFAIKACVLGYMLALGEGSAGKLVNDHMWAGIATTVLMVLAFVLREASLDAGSLRVHALYLVVLLLSMISLTVGSHHGASLVHGEDFLVARLPTSIKARLGIQEAVVQALRYDSPVYGSLIQPIFEQNCYGCHSAAKQKGQFRLDTIEQMQAGGKSKAPGLAPGSAGESEIYTRIRLGRNQKGAMPPQEELPLEDEQVALIRWWIEGGGSESQTIDDLAYEDFPDRVEAIITDLIRSEAVSVEPLTEETLSVVAEQVKETYGIDVIPHSQDLADGVYVVARNAVDTVPVQAFRDLQAIGSHVTSMNLWKRKFAEGAVGEIAGFPRLASLHLNETDVSAPDLAVLAGLRELRTLNLHGTEIGDDAIEILAGLRSLRRLHLQGTAISETGRESLSLALRRCDVLPAVEPGPPSDSGEKSK